MVDSEHPRTDAPSDAAPDSDADERREGESEGRTSSGGRDIVVPLRLYKTITVFSTLIAVVCVVVGFVLLDAATVQVSVLRSVLAGALAAVGADVPADALNAALAVVGLAVIGFGAGVYVLGTRFRAREMGKSQEDSDEPSDNG